MNIHYLSHCHDQNLPKNNLGRNSLFGTQFEGIFNYIIEGLVEGAGGEAEHITFTAKKQNE